MGASRYMSALWFDPNMVSECGVLDSPYGAFAGGLRWLGSVRDGLASGILSDHSENRAISKATLALPWLLEVAARCFHFWAMPCLMLPAEVSGCSQ